MILADPAILEQHRVPRGVKLFLKEYGAEVEIGDKKFIYISFRLHWEWEDELAYSKKHGGRGGAAPAHSCNLAKFEKYMPKRADKRPGVKPGTFHPVSINTWLHDYKGKLLVQLTEVGERHRCDAGCD